MIHVICRLTGKNRDQLRDPTLGNRVWATFTFLYINSDLVSYRCVPDPRCALTCCEHSTRNVKAKFHYTDPTGPARTQRSFAAKKVVAGPVGSVSGPCSGI